MKFIEHIIKDQALNPVIEIFLQHRIDITLGKELYIRELFEFDFLLFFLYRYFRINTAFIASFLADIRKYYDASYVEKLVKNDFNTIVMIICDIVHRAEVDDYEVIKDNITTILKFINSDKIVNLNVYSSTDRAYYYPIEYFIKQYNKKKSNSNLYKNIIKSFVEYGADLALSRYDGKSMRQLIVDSAIWTEKEILEMLPVSKNDAQERSQRARR